MYVRFQSPTPNRRGVHIGIFGLANTLAHRGELTGAENAVWRAGNDWYNDAYPDPTATDPTVYDRELNPQATAWFKSTATHLLDRVPAYLDLLAAHGVAYERVEALDPGRVIYEDAVQAVVVPHPPSQRSADPAALQSPS
ncbi:hypothetical protein [Nocardioides korecus]